MRKLARTLAALVAFALPVTAAEQAVDHQHGGVSTHAIDWD